MNRSQLVEVAEDVLVSSYGTPAMPMDRITAVKVVDAILPQVSTVEELLAVPDGTWLIGWSPNEKRPYFWTPTSDMRERSSVYLAAFGPFTVWQP